MHSATVVFAHGFGETAQKWNQLAAALHQDERLKHAKFIFPQAEERKVTLWTKDGTVARAWFDIPTWNDIQANVNDEAGILQAREDLISLIEQETRTGIPLSRIFLGGFSQGGCVALFTGLTTPYLLGGIFGLSTYLPMIDRVKQLVAENQPTLDSHTKTGFFLGHGNGDPKVKWQWGQRTAAAIEEMGFPLEFRTYRGMFHGVCNEEIEDLKEFLASHQT